MEEKIVFMGRTLWKSEADILNNLNKKIEYTFKEKNNSVIEITLFKSDLDVIGDKLVRFPYLEWIRFNQIVVNSMPTWIRLCPSLTQLSFNNSKITDVSVLSDIKNLKYLCLSSCNLTGLPMILESLVNLRELDLSFNSIEEVPEVIQYFPKLEKLSLNSNGLSVLPDWLSEKNQHLRSLDLNNNEFRSFPEQILLLENLENLDLASNNIRNIPKEIRNLSNLKFLNLQRNHLTILPDSIVLLKMLKTIYLSNNLLEEYELRHIIDPLRNNGCHIYFY